MRFSFFVSNTSLQQTTRVYSWSRKNPRPILQDRVQDQDRKSQDQDQDQDHKKSVSSALEIETEVSRTTSLHDPMCRRRTHLPSYYGPVAIKRLT
mgnify:CR=1 FL=1